MVARDFPGAQSLGEAIAVAPGRVLAHVARNASGLPAAAWSLAADRFAWSPLAAWVWRLAAALALVLAAAFAGRTWLAALRAWPTPVVLLLAASLGMLGAALAIWPHPKLLYPCVPLLSAAIGSALAALAARAGRAGRIALWGLPAALVGIALAGPRPFPRQPQAMAVRDAARVVREHVPPGRATVVALHGRALPAFARRADLNGAEPTLAMFEAPSALRAELEALRPEYVLLHLDAAVALPRLYGTTLAFAMQQGYGLAALTPRCWLFRR